jgi:hypothetical protein
MRRSILSSCLALALVVVSNPSCEPARAGAPPVQAPATDRAIELHFDDGSYEEVLGVAAGTTGYQSVSLTRFTPSATQLPAVLDTVSILFPKTFPNGAPTGLQDDQHFQVLVYLDPSGSANPANAALVLRQDFRLSPANARYQDVRLDRTVTVSRGDVWIGYTNAGTAADHRRIFHAAIDTNSSRQRSWLFYNSNVEPRDFDGEDLSAAQVRTRLDDIGFAGNWLIRASGPLVVLSVTPDFAPSPSADICSELDITLTGAGFDGRIASVFLSASPDGSGARLDLTNVRNVAIDTVVTTVPLDLVASEDPYFVFVERVDGLRSSAYGTEPSDLQVTWARFSDTCIQFAPPDPEAPDGGPRITGVVRSPCFGPVVAQAFDAQELGAPSPASTVVAYKVYRSTQPNVTPSPNNIFGTLPPNQILTGLPRKRTGNNQAAYYVLTACRADGSESPPSSEVAVVPPTLTAPPKVTNAKIVIRATGLVSTPRPVGVSVDDIPFVSAPVVKKTTKLVQKGLLANGQSIGQYLQPGRTVQIKIQNGDGATVVIDYTR